MAVEGSKSEASFEYEKHSRKQFCAGHWPQFLPGGPPWGSDAAELAKLLTAAGLRQQLWEPAQGSLPERENEWLGLWQRQ